MRQITSSLAIALVLGLNGAALAQDQDEAHQGWYLRGGPVGVFFSPGVDLSVAGATFPGADVSVDPNYSLSFDIGYRFNEQLSGSFTFGIPPTAEVRGAGALAGSYLGDVTYAPAVLALQYRIPTGNPRFEPYVGAGINYTIMLDSDDRDVAGFEVDNGWGPVLQVGFESMINDRLGVYFDVKKIWIETDARGTLGAGGPPAAAKVTLDPLLVGTGLVWRF
jgi:outer membrane protein